MQRWAVQVATSLQVVPSTALPYTHEMYSFIETKLFSRLAADVLTDEEYAKLQDTLCKDPEAGDLIPGSGGIRKLRWSVAGRGKRGGIRVIYYARVRRGQFWMLTLYAKNVRENIPAHVLRQIKEEIDD
jgi:hypothetical protein